MKIGICGTHGTGKTSLAHALVGKLKEKGHDAGFIEESVRRCPLPTGTEKRNSVYAQAWIAADQIQKEIVHGQRHEILICDRTIIDNYAYFLWNLKRYKKADLVVKTVQNMFKNWKNSYDFVFKLPIIPRKLQKDKFRSKDPKWQRDIDKLIDKIVKNNRIKIYELPVEPNRKRIEKILKMTKL